MLHVHFSFYFSFFLFLFPFQLIVQRYRSEKALGMRDNPQTYFLFTCTIRRLGNSALVNYVKWFVDLACYKVSQLKVCALSRVKHIFVIVEQKLRLPIWRRELRNFSELNMDTFGFLFFRPQHGGGQKIFHMFCDRFLLQVCIALKKNDCFHSWVWWPITSIEELTGNACFIYENWKHI